MIRISHGMARVELDGFDFQVASGRTVTSAYPTDDLLEACRRALLAADDARSDALDELLRATEEPK